jgi:hypothetical protein
VRGQQDEDESSEESVQSQKSEGEELGGGLYKKWKEKLKEERRQGKEVGRKRMVLQGEDKFWREKKRKKVEEEEEELPLHS